MHLFMGGVVLPGSMSTFAKEVQFARHGRKPEFRAGCLHLLGPCSSALLPFLFGGGFP